MDASFEFRPFSADARNFTSTRNKRCDKEKYNFFKYFSIRTDSLVGYKAIKKRKEKKKKERKEDDEERKEKRKEKKKKAEVHPSGSDFNKASVSTPTP